MRRRKVFICEAPNDCIKNSDLRLLMIATFRYSLGRRTYMPSFITDLIIKNKKIFNEKDWKEFINETNDTNDLGDPCDIQTWNKLLHFCQNKLANK